MKDINFRFKKSNEVEFRRRNAFLIHFLANFPGGREVLVTLEKIKKAIKVWKARIIMDKFKLEDLDDTTLETNDPYSLS